MRKKIYLAIIILSFVIGVLLFLSNNDFYITSFMVGVYFMFKMILTDPFTDDEL